MELHPNSTPYVFMAKSLIKHRDNFTFTFKYVLIFNTDCKFMPSFRIN